jgi:hypothetical protein
MNCGLLRRGGVLLPGIATTLLEVQQVCEGSPGGLPSPGADRRKKTEKKSLRSALGRVAGFFGQAFPAFAVVYGGGGLRWASRSHRRLCDKGRVCEHAAVIEVRQTNIYIYIYICIYIYIYIYI